LLNDGIRSHVSVRWLSFGSPLVDGGGVHITQKLGKALIARYRLALGDPIKGRGNPAKPIL
jgi:hypothetical protein